jgi:hypothetical protein
MSGSKIVKRTGEAVLPPVNPEMEENEPEDEDDEEEGEEQEENHQKTPDGWVCSQCFTFYLY